ncbi:MAG TPA: DUF1905 domain-containing protein [Pedococcus sp.]|nr:DUF1905 domain-containing protein [Pedococcus sp.]
MVRAGADQLHGHAVHHRGHDPRAVAKANASERLSSRGQVAVRISISGHDFETVVEPDGRGAHWIRVAEALQRAVGVSPNDTAEMTLDVSPVWPSSRAR